MTRLDGAAEQVAALAEQVLDHAHGDVWNVEWEYDDENPLRDAATGVERFRRWQSTGQDDYLGLRAGLEPQAAYADGITIALAALLRSWEDYGRPLVPGLLRDAENALAEYYEARQDEGGPGLLNAHTWAR